MAKLYQITFSPTGTSRMVAEWISEMFKITVIPIDLCDKSYKKPFIEKEDICIFAVPCYGGRIPKIVNDRLSGIQGYQTSSIICITYGNRAYEDALLELANVVGDNGFQVVAGCTVVTEHNILTQFARGRPSSKDKKEIQEFALLSSKKILENDSTRPVIPGSFSYKQWDGVRLNIRINYDTCINCGLCFEKCPVNAVFEKSWQCDMEKCILCMRCIKICPNQSRYLEPNVIARMTEDMRKFCESRKENEYYL